MKILVTGAAGFIGSKLMQELKERGEAVVGIDNFDAYYDPALKQARVQAFGLEVLPGDVTDKASLDALFAREAFDTVVHLAAQAGVRHSIEQPYAYLDSNLAGFLNVLEACRHYGVKHLFFASSSSVYGDHVEGASREDDPTDCPVSLYAATKKGDELMAHAYSRLYGITTTGLRLFSVYGPWGRPDMAPMLFAKAICAGETIPVFNHGEMWRDFTYIDDVVEGILRLMSRSGGLAPASHAIYNIGSAHPVKLTDFIDALEQSLGRTTAKQYLPMQPGDVCRTAADITRLERETGFRPHISLGEGIARFAEWYKAYVL